MKNPSLIATIIDGTCRCTLCVLYIMLVRRFEPKGRRFTNFHYYYYFVHCDVYNPDPEPRLLEKGTHKDSSRFSVALCLKKAHTKTRLVLVLRYA